MADIVHEAADKEITRLARAMAREFKQAHKDMAKRLEKKLAAYERELIQWQKDLKADKCTEKEFKAWKNARCADLGRTQGLTEVLANDLVQADQRATEHIHGALPGVYAENYNYGSYQAQQGKIVPTFALYDEGTIANLLDEDKQLLPAPKVNIPKDMSWNASHVRSALTQSFLTGESIPDMAKRLRGVADMNVRSAIRIARTAITGTENRARVDSYVAANDMGINCEKQWMASLDGRTRDSHRVLDGQHVKPDAVFDNGCRFPGDPQAPVGEVYNCRCTLVAYIPGHNTMKDRSEATVGSLSYAEWKAGVREQQPESASGRSLEKFLKLPSVQKRVKASGMSKKKLTDAMRQEMRNQGYQDLRAFKTLPKSRQQNTLTQILRESTTDRIKWPSHGVMLSNRQYKSLREEALSVGLKLNGFRRSDADPAAVRQAIYSFKKVIGSDKRIANAIGGDMTLKISGMMSSDFAYVLRNDTSIIHINADAYRSKRALEKEYSKLVDNGFFVSGTTAESIIFHELGHVVTINANIDPLNVLTAVTGKNKAESLLIAEQRLSSYSSMYLDGTEIISEAFSGYYGRTGNEFANLIFREVIRRLI